jgi:hypothetical protein
MNKKVKSTLIVGLTILLCVFGQTVGPLVPVATAASPVVEVQTYGTTYGELSARWWQWLLSIPSAVNPNLDQSGANCALGQYDDVRTCTVPAGKPIFFPLINTISFKPSGSETLLDLRQLAATFIDSVNSLTCVFDGTDCVQNLLTFRVRSPSFTVIAPAKGLLPPGKLSVPGNTDPLVSDGYWLLLSPPTSGPHTIQFTAATSGGFSLNVTYNLTVVP